MFGNGGVVLMSCTSPERRVVAALVMGAELDNLD